MMCDAIANGIVCGVVGGLIFAAAIAVKERWRN